MSECGDRVALRGDGLDNEGFPVYDGESGIVVGHRGDEEIISMDTGEAFMGGNRIVIVPPTKVRAVRLPSRRRS